MTDSQTTACTERKPNYLAAIRDGVLGFGATFTGFAANGTSLTYSLILGISGGVALGLNKLVASTVDRDMQFWTPHLRYTAIAALGIGSSVLAYQNKDTITEKADQLFQGMQSNGIDTTIPPARTAPNAVPFKMAA